MRKGSKKRKWFGLLLLACSLGVVMMLLGARMWTESVAEGKVFTSVEEIPVRRVGLVLGCARHVSNGRINLYFLKRIRAAVELYEAGKVEVLLVSGDNSRKGYGEPTDMKNALIEAGIPEDRIVCDFAGFSTLDSMVRAGRVFEVDELTVVSQEFHVRRAIFIGAFREVDAIGYCAEDVSGRYGLRVQIREYLARVKTVLDVTLFNRQPRFLGEKLPIG
jgi:SanA protein